MKKNKANKKLIRAFLGSVATMGVIESMCGEQFLMRLINDISLMDLEKRLTFWNLVNVKMNPDVRTHIFCGAMAHHPKMRELVDCVCEEIVKQMKSNN